MNAIWTIAKRELRSFFDSLTAYILLIAFLGFSGFFTWLFGSDIFIRGQADLRVFFSIAQWSLFFFIPALTMKMLAEEKKVGTIELLLTKAVSDREVVVGKFLACLLLILIALGFTLPYYFTVASLGQFDHGAAICGYLGLLFLSSAYIAIGLWASSITNNQIVAFLVALIVGLFFQLFFGMLASQVSGFIGSVLDNLNLLGHFESISRGVLDTKDIFYFLSITAMGLILSELNLAKR